VLQEILNETLQELESEQQWQYLMQITKDLFVNEEQITPEQAEQLIKSCFVDYSVDFFADGVKRWELLPRSTASETVHVLARMFKEVANADCR
jgi:hypothetical protein